MSTSAVTTVVHVITRLELGGAQQNTLATCAKLDRSRFRVILAYGPGGILDDEAQRLPDVTQWPIPALVRDVQPTSDSAAARALFSHLREAMRDHADAGLNPARFIVHTHSSKAGILGRSAAAMARVPLIIHSIHGFGFHPGQHPAKFNMFVNAERLAGRVTHAFFSVSEASLREARARKIVRPHHDARIIRSGMDLTEYKVDDARRAAARRALGLPEGAEVFLTIGNFKPQKDPLTLIAGFGRVAARRPRTHLLVAGDGPLRPDVQRAISASGLTERIHLLGWRTDVPDLLAASDVVVLASIFEGLPRSAVQAVAAGRPFVGTNVDGTPEIIRHGQNGYLVPPRAPEPLAEMMEKALLLRPVDPLDHQRLVDWDVDTMVRQQETAYDQLLERR